MTDRFCLKLGSLYGDEKEVESNFGKLLFTFAYFLLVILRQGKAMKA